MRFIVNKQCTLEEALAIIAEPRDKVAVDVETVSIDNLLPIGIAVASSPKVGFYFFNVKDELAHQMIDNKTVLCHNAVFDLPILRKEGFKIPNYEDTMLMAYSAGILDNSLYDLSQSLLLKECPKVTDLWKKKDQGNVSIDHVKLGEISIIHACLTYSLEQTLSKTNLYYTIDKPCIELLIEMESHGLLIDQYTLTKVEQTIINKVSLLEKELQEELKVDNLMSNVQVSLALKNKGIIGTRKTKSAADSVSEESLKPLNLPLTNKLLKYRSLMKNLTTYIPFMRNVDNRGRIHTHFGYTRTGRWRSYNPNLQNLTRDELFND